MPEAENKKVKELNLVLDPELHINQGLGYTLFQIRILAKAENPILEFCFDSHLPPNRLANGATRYARKKMTALTPNAADANCCRFNFGRKYPVEGALAEQVAGMVVSQVVPALVNVFDKTLFKSKPAEIRFYTDQSSLQYIEFMHQTLEMTDMPVRYASVMMDKQNMVPGISLSL